MRLALYQPDIPQNTGSIIRLAACFGVSLDVIEPCGFPFDPVRIKRAAMDYSDHAEIHRHASWQAFLAYQRSNLPESRLILASTKGTTPYHAHRFTPNDIILMGRESSGVPESVVEAADVSVYIPIHPPARSLNVAQAAAILVSEAIRQQQSTTTK